LIGYGAALKILNSRKGLVAMNELGGTMMPAPIAYFSQFNDKVIRICAVRKTVIFMLALAISAAVSSPKADAALLFFFDETDFTNAGGLATVQQDESDFNESITDFNTLTSSSGLTVFNSGGLYKPTANSVFSLTSNSLNVFNISPNATALSGLVGLWNGSALVSGNITVTAGIAGGSSESSVFNSVAGGSFQFFGIIADSGLPGLSDFDAVSFSTTTGAVVTGLGSVSSGQAGVSAVPEPSALFVFVALLGAFVVVAKRRRIVGENGLAV
jgi:hypothetical protein